MTERESAPRALPLLRGSGLDTSNGTEFVQQRIALFAKIIAILSFAFLIIGYILSAVFRLPLVKVLDSGNHIAHIGGLLFLTAIWLACRRGRNSLSLLGVLDAAAVIGSSTAWSFFIFMPAPDSIHPAVLSVILTVLTRAIVVPSKAARTLRLTMLAVAPLLALMWGFWFTQALGRASGPPYGPWVTVINQSLLLVAVVGMSTITSRIIYDLRRTVREANELGQYALEEKLGAGGMGEVWRARHRLLVRPAAVKLVRPELLASGRADPERVLRRFEREARATAALRSPHTVQLYDFGQAEDGTLFYVMELLIGIDLEKLVSRFGPVPAERAVHILKQVCHALGEAHQNGLTHRDVKPANIFVSGIGTELDFVKVLDFGLVRFRPEQTAGDQMKLTAEGVVGGTPAYSAPEIALGEANYDHRVDIYALGCVGYWLLTGKLVFDADTAMKMMIDHARTPPPRPHTRTELPIPPELEQIIMDCLEKDPARRPATAEALAHRLSACPLSAQWTHERAERWWQLHMPRREQERPVADVLLSREGTPANVRELRPLRRAR